MEQGNLTIKDVQTQLETWRRNKDKMGYTIPVELWDKISILSKKYSFSDLTRVFRVSGSQLKNELAKRSNKLQDDVIENQPNKLQENKVELIEVHHSKIQVDKNQVVTENSKITCTISHNNGSSFILELPESVFHQIPSIFNQFLKG